MRKVTLILIVAALAAVQFGGFHYADDEIVKLVCFDDDDTAVDVFGNMLPCFSTN
jgi:hypothetical protein